MDDHVHAFAFSGAVPLSIVYDNDHRLVSKILPDGTRKRARLFSAPLSHHLIRDRYSHSGKGNDKGSVEGLAGYTRRNFMVPIPRFPTWEAFNLWLEVQCRKRRNERACGQISDQVLYQSLVRYRTNDCSIPARLGHREVWIRGYLDEVAIDRQGEIIARHVRSYGREDVQFITFL